MSVFGPRCASSGLFLEESCGRLISVAVEGPSPDCGGECSVHLPI